MDLYCPICGEPWDLESLHEIDAADYQAKRRRFRREGCAAWDTAHNLPEGRTDLEGGLRASASAVLLDVFGDDVDGVAATLDDADAAGWFTAEEHFRQASRD